MIYKFIEIENAIFQDLENFEKEVFQNGKVVNIFIDGEVLDLCLGIFYGKSTQK